MKGRPWGMMRMAKFKCPSSDKSSRLEHRGLSMRVEETTTPNQKKLDSMENANKKKESSDF